MEIIKKEFSQLTEFDPEKTKIKIVKLDALSEYAKAIQDWPLLEEAVDAKIEEQIEFCAWWLKTVTPHGGGRRSNGVTELQPHKVGEWKVTVHRWRNYLKAKQQYRARLLGAEYRAALLEGNTTYEDHENENDEMFTPPQYIEAARAVMGEIDLDPASCVEAQKIIKAHQFFTKAESGLMKEWGGRVWLNPPYSDPLLYDFCDKLLRELSDGHITEAILLTNSSTDTAWWHKAEEIALHICFTRGRVHFIDSLRGEKTPTRGQCFFYFGDDGKRFGEIFREFGAIR